MRIGVNTLYLLPGRVGGSETYIANIIKWLVSLDKDNEYIVFINNECKGYFENISPNIKTVQCNVNASSRVKRVIWEQILLPFQIKKQKIDLLFSGGFTAPFLSPVKSVLMIFDMQHINQPENFSPVFLFFLKTIIFVSVKSSDHILTLSNNSKEDIVKHYELLPDCVTPTYLASDRDVFYKRGDDEVVMVLKKYGIKKPYIHYAAAILPHKNHISLLNAFKNIKEKFPDLKLVLTGARDYSDNNITKHIASLGLDSDVVLLGWLSFDEVASIYSGAELFVFPSTHEGFGMPVLEAMCTDTPVISSNIEPLKEIVGDGALLFDPHNEDSIKEAMLSVLENNELRKTLVTKGALRAKHFTWEHAAEKTIEIFNTFKT